MGKNFAYSLYILDPARVPVALLAFLLVIIASFCRKPGKNGINPLLWGSIERLFGGIGDRLDRPARPAADLIFRGFLLTMAMLLVVGAIFTLISWPAYPARYHWVLETIVLTTALGAAAPQLLLRLEAKLAGRREEAGLYLALSRSSARNLALADESATTRIAGGYAVRAFDKQMVAPLFWYVLAGMPAVLLYTSLACFTWRFGKDGFGKGFCLFPSSMERLMGFVPGLLAAWLIVLAALFTPKAGPVRAVRGLFTRKGRANYAEGGAPLTAAAWALIMSLGGPAQDLSGSAIQSAWIGPPAASAKEGRRQLRRVFYLLAVAHILLAAALCGLYWGLNILPRKGGAE